MQSVIRQLQIAGANVPQYLEFQEPNGCTPLIAACKSGNFACVDMVNFPLQCSLHRIEKGQRTPQVNLQPQGPKISTGAAHGYPTYPISASVWKKWIMQLIGI
jgi:hypothetical protein